MSDKILKISNSGIEAADERMKALMNNMVNAETPGYKASDVTVRAFPLELEAASSRLDTRSTMQPVVEDTFYNHAPGALIRTGNPTDLAIGGDGFFVIEGSWGEGYTRDGRFTLDSEGRLVSVSSNFPVLGKSGQITIDAGSKFDVSETGVIRVNDVVVDKIRVVSIDNPNSLEPVNNSIFKYPDGPSSMKEMDSPKIIQGYVESSNVSMIDEMSKLVILSRIYGINTKVVTTRDAVLSKALEIGKMQ